MRPVIPIAAESTAEWHITSLVVHVLPARVALVASQIAVVPGAEVHAMAPEGKVIVTLEGAHSRVIVDAISAIQALDGVINATPVYQCADTLESMNEELPDAHCP